MTIPTDNNSKKDKSRQPDSKPASPDSGLTKAQVPQNSQTIAPGGALSHRHVPPALDKDGMPLPQRVDEVDLNATRVTPAAYNVKSQPSPTQPKPKSRKALGC